MPKVTEEILAARARWRFNGSVRPEFADVVGPGQESVWDYPRPPRLEADRRPVEVYADGVALAQTEGAFRVLETASPPAYYLPPYDVRAELLVAETSQSLCEWKGRAVYWSLHMGNVRVKDVAWSYPEPYPEYEPLAGYLAFYPAKLNCLILGMPVSAQPGGLYGGWVTPNIVGPFKGAPGTEWW